MPRLAPPPATLPAVLATVVALAGCGGSSSGSKTAATATSTATPASTQSAAQAGGCKQVPQPPAKNVKLSKPTERLAKGKTYVAKVVTSCGEFDITLDAKRAPRTGGSFKYLADKHFYDNLTFHRISQGFVIQGGDPKGDGTGGPGYSVVEAPPKTFKYAKYEVAMAKTQTEAPGTSGSQFFIVSGADAALPPEYAVLGHVAAGMAAVQRIAALPTQPSEMPVKPVVIRSATLSSR
jgi:peptidyl-prolyl cis-trans isomerase B (cyclophilin B)